MESDSTAEPPLPISTAGYELLTRATTSHGTALSLASDGIEGSGTRQVKSNERVSAILSDGHMTFAPEDEPPAGCASGKGELRADLADLGFSAARRIALGVSWSDSISVGVCIAGVPGTAGIARRFEPVGDTTLEGKPAVIVRRTDTITARASGVLDQHAVSLSAGGSSTTRLYVSDQSGKVLRAAKVLLLRIVATTTNRTRTFVESSTSVVQLVR